METSAGLRTTTHEDNSYIVEKHSDSSNDGYQVEQRTTAAGATIIRADGVVVSDEDISWRLGGWDETQSAFSSTDLLPMESWKE